MEKIIGMMPLRHRLNGTVVSIVKNTGEPVVSDGSSEFSIDRKYLFPMTPAGQAKSVGLNSLTQVSQITGVSLNTLTNWHRNKPELFRIVLLGCLADVGA